MADAPARFKDLCLDANDHHALADWWCAAMGYARRDDLEDAQDPEERTPEDDEPRPHDWPIPIVDAAGEGPLIWVVPVPERKTVKNRMHFDVVGETWPLIAAGARLVREADDEIEWSVLADPEGNEFCVFAPED